MYFLPLVFLFLPEDFCFFRPFRKKNLPGALGFFCRKPLTLIFNSGSSPSQVQKKRVQAVTSVASHGFSKALMSLLCAYAHTKYSCLWSSFGQFLGHCSTCI